MISKALIKQLTFLSFPVLLSNLLQTLITVVDTIMVGQLGPLEIASIGIGNTIRFLLFVTVMSVAGGAMSLIAQAKGGRDKKRMSVVTRQSILSGLILSFILGSLGYIFAEPMVRFMESGGDETTILLAINYLQIVFISSPFLLINFIQNRLMQGAGDTLTPLKITAALFVLNVMLNYILIYGNGLVPALGVEGAALGTMIARAVMAVFGMWLFYSGKNVIKVLQGSWKPDWLMIKDILNIGVPSGIQGFFRHVANVMIVKLVTATTLGTLGAATIAIGIQVESLLLQPVLGINVAGTSLIGQALGRWQTKAAFLKGNAMILLGVIVMIAFLTPVLVWPKVIIKLFDPSADPLIIKSTISFFFITMSVLPLYAVALVATGMMRGAGDTKPAMISSILGRNILTISLSWYLAFPMGMDYEGIWIGIAIGKLFDFIYMAIAWYRRNWYYVALKRSKLFRMHLNKLSDSVMKDFLREVRGPSMAISGTQEYVHKEYVSYISGRGTKSYRFSGDSYKDA